MSDFAIAAVTATLRSLLNRQTGADVTTLPLDKAATVGQANRLNLFLYYMAPNAAWRNQTLPNKVKRGETGKPPLALNLYYLLTAYGDDQTDEADHRLLGTGMRILHDKGVLDSDDIFEGTNASDVLKTAELGEQYERVKLTPEPLTLEEMSKLWTTFQTQYRISAAFQASVVLIESKQAVKSPLPVLKRGEEDRGVDVIPSMPGLLEGIVYGDVRVRQPVFPAAQLGEIITLQGRNLPGTRCVVVFTDPKRKPTAANPRAHIVATLRPEPNSDDTKIFVRLDPNSPDWISGPLLVLLEDLPQPGVKHPARSNALGIGLAPSLLVDGEFRSTILIENVRRQLVLNCTPPISRIDPGRGEKLKWPDVSLLLSPVTDSPLIPPLPLNVDSASLTETTPVFQLPVEIRGQYRVRLRIETVESLVMQRDGGRLEFDERQKVVIR